MQLLALRYRCWGKFGLKAISSCFLLDLSRLKLYIIILNKIYSPLKVGLGIKWRRGQYRKMSTCKFSFPNTNIKILTTSSSTPFISKFIDTKIIYIFIIRVRYMFPSDPLPLRFLIFSSYIFYLHCQYPFKIYASQY
jgi:hypothetical protein